MAAFTQPFIITFFRCYTLKMKKKNDIVIFFDKRITFYSIDAC